MQGFSIKKSDLDKLNLDDRVASEIRRMEQERTSWMKAVTQSHSLAEQMKRLAGESSFASQVAKQVKNLQAYSSAEQMKVPIPEMSLAVQTAKQLQEWQKAEQEGIRRMLDPIQNIRKGFLEDSATKLMLANLARPMSASDQMVKLMEQATRSSDFVKTMHSSVERSMESARKLLADASVSSGVAQLMRSFEEANKRWVVPQPLLNSLGSLQAVQEQMGRLSLPVIDVASAATLAKMLGPEGIQAQLSAMGINPDGSINVQFAQQEEGIGLSRKSLELMALLSFILALLVPFYQEIKSSTWQSATDEALATHTQKLQAQGEVLEEQRKMIEALTKLVEKALVQVATRQEERFVVLDRVAVVRAQPKHGSAVEGKLLPREVVRPISGSGKWIELEYYHWLHKEYRTGWALKKYFQRVPANFLKADEGAAKAQ